MRAKSDTISEAYVKALAICNAELQRKGITRKAVADALDIGYSTATNFLNMKLINIHLLDLLIIHLQMKVIIYLED